MSCSFFWLFNELPKSSKSVNLSKFCSYSNIKYPLVENSLVFKPFMPTDFTPEFKLPLPL